MSVSSIVNCSSVQASPNGSQRVDLEVSEPVSVVSEKALSSIRQNQPQFAESSVALNHSRVFWINHPAVTVYDLTKERQVSKQFNPRFRFEELCIGNVSVSIGMQSGLCAPNFSKKNGTKFVWVQDGPEPYQKTIRENMLHSIQVWVIDTRFQAAIFWGYNQEINDPTSIALTYVARPLDNRTSPLSAKMISELPCSVSIRSHQVQRINQLISGSILSSKQMKKHHLRLQNDLAYQSMFLQKKQRVHSFCDKSIQLLDYTKQGGISIAFDSLLSTDFICWNKKKIMLPNMIQKEPLISYNLFTRGSPWFTDLVIVRDAPDANGIQIERWMALPSGPNPFSVVTTYVDISCPETEMINIPTADGQFEKGYLFGPDLIEMEIPITSTSTGTDGSSIR